MWREELQSREKSYWHGKIKRDNDLARVLEGKDKEIMETLLNRDQLWLNRLKSFTDHLKTVNDF